MTSPEPDESDQQHQDDNDVPPANPAYATPPPEGLPDAEEN